MNSLRFHLIAMVLLATLPMVGLVIFGNLEQRRTATLESQRQLLLLVQHADADYRRAIRQTKQLLIALANANALTPQNSTACTTLFDRLIKENNLYLNILAATPSGEIFASASPVKKSTNLSDRSYFQRALDTQKFTIGELVFGVTLGIPTLPCAYPVIDHAGQVRAIVAAGLNLDWLQTIHLSAELPTDTSLTIINKLGRVMFNQQDPEKWVGRDVSDDPIVQLIMDQKQGWLTATDIDGVPKMYAFMPLRDQPHDGFIYAGIPTQTVYAQPNRLFVRNFLILGSVIVIILTLTWPFGYLAITRRMAILTNTTKKLASGDLTARTEMKYGQGEIDSLARAFDELATSLQQREADRQKAEEGRQKLEAQFLQAQKMEAIGRLAGGVAHDFNNLLTAIIGYNEIMMLELPPASPLYQYPVEIMKAANMAASLTSRLLAFSRKQILQPTALNLNDIISNMETMMRRLLGEDIEFLSRLQPELGAIKVDPSQLEQVIMNLAVNARDAMPQGGRLTLETDNIFLDETFTWKDNAVIPGSYIMLAISDSGIGMDNATQAQIFEPFFTTKDVDKGTGLGLAMVYGIVKQSGGYIWVYSEPGKGSTFKIFLPRVEEKVETVKALEIVPEFAQTGETILIVEDNEALRVIISKSLQKFGYQVIAAANGEEASQICETGRDKIDLLLTDVVMPLMSGGELAARVKLLYPEMKVLFMSGYTDDAIVHHGIANTGFPFLAKPFRPTVLVQKVRQVLDR